MLISKLRIGTALLLALGAAALVAGGAARQAMARPEAPVRAAEKATRAKAPAPPVIDASAVPKGPMPFPVLANIDRDGSVVTHHIVTEIHVQRVTGADGEERVITEPVIIPKMHRGEKDVVKVFDTKGKRVEPKVWARLLKKPVLALAYFHGGTPDPQHLRLIKEGALVLVLPPPPPLAGTLVPAVPLPGPGALPPAPSMPIPGGPVPPPAPGTPLPAGYSAPTTTPALPPRNP